MGGFKWAGGPLQTAQVLAVLPFDYGSTAPSARIINRQQHRMEIKARSRSGSIDGIAHRRTQRHAPVRRAMSALAVSSHDRKDRRSQHSARRGGFSRHRSTKQNRQGVLTAFERNRQQ